MRVRLRYGGQNEHSDHFTFQLVLLRRLSGWRLCSSPMVTSIYTKLNVMHRQRNWNSATRPNQGLSMPKDVLSKEDGCRNAIAPSVFRVHLLSIRKERNRAHKIVVQERTRLQWVFVCSMVAERTRCRDHSDLVISRRQKCFFTPQKFCEFRGIFEK